MCLYSMRIKKTKFLIATTVIIVFCNIQGKMGEKIKVFVDVLKSPTIIVIENIWDCLHNLLFKRDHVHIHTRPTHMYVE